MISAFKAKTLTLLHDRLCERLVSASRDQLDVISNVDVQLHNTVSVAKSLDWDFDLKSLWLTKSRWTMMCNQYLEGSELEQWINRCTSKVGSSGRGISVLRTKIVKARGGAATGHTNKESRRWGSCMLAISYKAKPRPQITLYSRTSYLGYLSALDLSIAWMGARYIAKGLGIAVEDISFVWMNEALQYHNFKSMAYLLNHTDDDQREAYRRLILLADAELKKKEVRRIEESPALILTRRWMQRMLKLDTDGVTLGDMNYNTYRRIRRRFHTEVLGYKTAQKFEGWSQYKQGPKQGENKEYFKAYQPLPSVRIHDLDFSCLGLSI